MKLTKTVARFVGSLVAVAAIGSVATAAINADKQYRLKQAVRDTAFGRTLAIGTVEFQDTKIASAALKTLNATPVAVVTAPGSGRCIIFEGASLYLTAGTAYGAPAAGSDLGFKYTDGSGAQVAAATETTGFLNQTAALLRFAHAGTAAAGTVSDVTPVANAALVLHNLSATEYATGTGDLYVRVYFRTVPTVFPSATE